MHRYAGAGLVLAALALGCGDSARNTGVESPTPWPITAFPARPDIMNDVPEARVELGRLLFFDPILSVDRQTACVTCHSEIWGMGDGIARAVGHGAGLLAGPGRRGPNMLRRNSPALYNLAFRPSLLWDGSAQTLEAQALIPIFEEDEMNADRETLAADLAGIPEYAELFENAIRERCSSSTTAGEREHEQGVGIVVLTLRYEEIRAVTRLRIGLGDRLVDGAAGATCEYQGCEEIYKHTIRTHGYSPGRQI